MSLANPFSYFRTEQANDASLAEHFVKPSFLSQVARDSAVIIRGGRGTGKTSVLKYLSFDVQSLEYQKRRRKLDGLTGYLDTTKNIGIYYRLNTASFSLLKGHEWNEGQWVFFFGHYLNLILVQKIWDVTTKLFKERATSAPRNLLDDLGDSLLAGFQLASQRDSQKVMGSLRGEQAKLESFFVRMAYSKSDLPPSLTLPGQPIFEFCELLTSSVPELNTCVFSIMLDEFENLLTYQQRVVNTLVKHTRYPVFFKIAGRHYGFRTSDTLNAQERIEDGQDFVAIDLEKAISPNAYRKLLKKICAKRLQSVPFFRERKLSDIERIFQVISPEQEARIGCGSKPRKQRQKIIDVLILHKLAPENASLLFSEENPLLERFNYALLCRGRPFEEVVASYSAYVTGTYHESLSLYAKTYQKVQPNLLFQLLRDERGGRKRYCGFEVLADLSSGVIRKFIELCHQAVQFTLDEYDPDSNEPFEVSVDHQTEAVHGLSHTLFQSMGTDIPVKGPEIQMFIQRMGLLFKLINLEDEAISKPARSYFSTVNTTLDENTLQLLRLCVMHSILFERIGWKGNRIDHGRPNDYLFNRLLTPFFEMPYRGYDRTLLSADDLNAVAIGFTRSVANRLLKRSSHHSPGQLRLEDLLDAESSEDEL